MTKKQKLNEAGRAAYRTRSKGKPTRSIPMNIFYWNIRDVVNSKSRVALKFFYVSHKPLVLFIKEPMINFAQVPSWFWLDIGVTKYCIDNIQSLLPNL